MRPPGKGAADRRQGGPAGDQQARCRHLPEEAGRDVKDFAALVIGERLELGRQVDGGQALVVEAARRRLHDAVLGAVDDQAITEVQDGPAVIPPGATAADAIGGEDADPGLLLKEHGRRGGPVGAGLGGEQRLPVSDGRKP